MKLILSMVVLLMLSSCGSMDYFEAATQCDHNNKVPLVNEDGTVEVKDGEAVLVVTQGSCDAEWERYNKAEERRDNKEAYEELMKCPYGQVFICRDTWCTRKSISRIPRLPSKGEMVRSGCRVLRF